MAAFTSAQPPTAKITEIPGRYSPIYVVDRRNMAGYTTSTTTSSALAYLPRTESADSNFSVPTTSVTELGANFQVGEYDDLPESKLSLTCWDVSYDVISLITGKNCPINSTTTIGFQDLATANVDVVRQFADPNGNVFASMYLGDMVLDDYSASLKAKSAAMEMYSLSGFNMMMFRGFIITKAYKVLAADVTANSFSIASILGANEAPVPVPVPTGTQPASYYIQTGRLNFLKIERWRSGQGFVRYPEISTGTPVAGQTKYSGTTLSFAAGDLVAGDVFFLTYCSYGSSVANFNVIPTLSIDTSDPIAISTRLTPFTITANAIPRGQSLDIKMTLKRERAEGIGDTDGIWGPPDAPEVTINLDVKMTDLGINSIMTTGSALGTDSGGAVTGDFFDPAAMTRNQLASATPVVVTLNDPRNAGTIVKTITMPTAVFKTVDNKTSNKGAVTQTFTGADRVGNMTIACTRGAT